MLLHLQLGHLSLCAFPVVIILVCWVGLLPIPLVFALHSAQHLACAKLFLSGDLEAWLSLPVRQQSPLNSMSFLSPRLRSPFRGKAVPLACVC